MIITSQISLAKKDLYLTQIERLIDKKRKFLIDKHKTLGKISKENEYLQQVQNDYQNYYHFIMNEKIEQMKAMNIINEYIKTLLIKGKLTDKDIYDAKKQQKEIFNEVNKIKNSLDNLVKTTKT